MTTIVSTSDGVKLKLFIIEGSVLSVADSEHVVVNQSSSSVRYSHALNQTFNEPGSIYSEVIKTSKVWIKQDDGQDRQVDISDVPVPLRAGHRLKVGKVCKIDSELGYYWAAKNVNTGEVCWQPFGDNPRAADDLGISSPQSLKMLVLRPAKITIVVGLIFNTLWSLLIRDSRIWEFKTWVGYFWIIFVPLVVIALLKTRKDHLKPVAEITAQVEKALS